MRKEKEEEILFSHVYKCVVSECANKEDITLQPSVCIQEERVLKDRYDAIIRGPTYKYCMYLTFVR